MPSTRLPIIGMTCASCVGRVERALLKVEGVTSAAVNLAAEQAEIHTDRAIAQATLIQAIEAVGYDVPAQTHTLSVHGMTCASCVARVERALVAVPGVTLASVNLATENATVTGTAAIETLISAITDAGYDAGEITASSTATADLQQRRDHEAAALKRDTALAIALALPVFVMEMGGHLSPALHHAIDHSIGRHTSWLIQFVLTALILALPGRRFFSKGVPALLKGAPDMNSLVALGTASAFGFSCVATFAPALLPSSAVHVYFEAAAVIVALVLMGRYFEARAKGRTSEAIKRLAGLQPALAYVVRNGEAVETPLAQLQLGDLVRVRPGERIATDGIVSDGRSYVDEGMITGEPVPVLKEAGSAVTGGTVNQSGGFTFKATAVGAQTMLARIVRMVEQAQGSKLPIQAKIDQVTLWFVPAVIAAALLTFIVWWAWGPTPALTHAVVNAVAVLIIACPCAMGLATPTSIMVATGRAAELGVLFRKGDALQTLRDARVVAFDKTGTLTEGHPVMTDLYVSAGFAEDDVLALLASVESHSEHPLAQAVVNAARERGLAVPEATDFEAIAGMGVRAQVNGTIIAIGAERFMRHLQVDIAAVAEPMASHAKDAKTAFLAAIDGRLVAVLAVADPIRPTATPAVQALHSLGLQVAMISGDSSATAHAVAARLGIDHVVAEVLPEGKLHALAALRARHGKVAFAGDGINDAPALAEADVGIAMGTGTDVAMESADVVLMGGDLRGVITAVALSHATLRNIHQNLFWAFAYNAALIPIAAGALYPLYGLQLSPMIAAGAMALSSVFVVSNALRLRWFTPTLDTPASRDDEHPLQEQAR